MSAESGSAQGRKTGAAAGTVQERENSTHKKNGATRKRMCSKLSAVVATANFQQKKEKL
jgi:hypothetical protein